MTVVGGQCVREVFYNNDFNFLHGMYKVNCTMIYYSIYGELILRFVEL